MEILQQADLAGLIKRALAEDVGQGDITTAATVESSQSGLAHISVKEPGGIVFCGGVMLEQVFALTASEPTTTILASEGERLPHGAVAAEINGLLAGLLMLMTILLIGFAPVAWIFSQSTESLAWMGALHLIFWFIATFFGLRFLQTGFSHSNARSLAGFNTWVAIFMLVALQMTTALRPILGT